MLGDSRGRTSLSESPGLVPPRLALLAREVWKQERYSEGQLARMLHLDRHGIREVLDGAEREESEADELVKILPLVRTPFWWLTPAF